MTIAVAVIASTPGILAFLGQRKKSDVDVAGAYEAMAQRQAEQLTVLRKRLDDMEAEIDQLQCDIEARDKLLLEWQSGIGLLVNQVTANGLQPVWTPKGAPPPKRSKTS